MSATRRFLDSLRPHFVDDGRLAKFYAIYEMVDTFIYTPGERANGTVHVRDIVDLKRAMTYVVIATIFCVLMACYNTGYQANAALATTGADTIDNWRSLIMNMLGYSASNPLSNFVHGLLYFLPIYIVTLAVGGVWEVLFAVVRKHDVNEGFLVTSMLYTLILPPTIPLWQVALGISFGVVIGKEVFGGTGKNFLNPALTGRAFLYFAYPAYMSGDAVWVAVDGFSGATPLGLAATGGMDAIYQSGYTWLQSFMGFIPGSIGETSTLACLIGAAFLMITKVGSFELFLVCFWACLPPAHYLIYWAVIPIRCLQCLGIGIWWLVALRLVWRIWRLIQSARHKPIRDDGFMAF